MADIKDKFIPFNGGLDVETPPINVPPGMLRGSSNREQSISGGYTRIEGHERYDGQPSPSDAAYYILYVTITGALAVGNTIVGATSAATAQIIASSTTSAGATYIAVTKVVGTFTTETLNVGGVAQATLSSGPFQDAAATPLLQAQYKNLAADVYRNDIQKVPGSGNVLGVWVYNDVRYAWRNNAGGTKAVMFKATTAGWVAVTLYNEVSFTVGAVATPADGEVLTQGGVTATVKRAVTQNQTTAWAGAATGRLIITNPAGGNFVAGAATLSGGGTCTLSGAETAISFAVPGGRFECINKNFGGSANTTRMYGCDGKNRGFEFDGTVLVPIATGMSSDAPTHVWEHLLHLFFSFAGSAQHAAPGTPYVWSVILGAGELGMGDVITGFMSQAGSTTTGALNIFTRNTIGVLYGTGVSNWNLVTYKDEAGAFPYTIQKMAQTLMFDDRGITDLYASQVFGNFEDAALSRRVTKWLNGRRALVTASMRARDKSQYRLFFSDGYGLYCTFDHKKLLGMLPVVFPLPVKCCCSVELSDGTEEMYFGSSDGYVYQLDKGTSFDGAAIEEYVELHFNPLGSANYEKHFESCAVEVSGEGYAELNFSYQLSYGTTNIEQPASVSNTTNFSDRRWDDGGDWDTGQWDGITLQPSGFEMRGDGENVSLRIGSNADYFAATTLSGALIAYWMRRRVRRV